MNFEKSNVVASDNSKIFPRFVQAHEQWRSRYNNLTQSRTMLRMIFHVVIVLSSNKIGSKHLNLNTRVRIVARSSSFANKQNSDDSGDNSSDTPNDSTP